MIIAKGWDMCYYMVIIDIEVYIPTGGCLSWHEERGLKVLGVEVLRVKCREMPTMWPGRL